MATSILSTAKRFVTTGFAASYAGLSINSVKALVQRGELECHQTQGGHWRISTASLVSYVDGVEPDEQPTELAENRGIVIYARVSSASQASDGSLDRQIARLLKEVSEREGIDPGCIPVYSDICSSFCDRRQLNKLVDDMLDGKVKRIYCEFLDRLSRTPALTALIEHLARRTATDIVCLDTECMDPTELDYMLKELINYVTVLSNRINAAKSRQVTVKEVDSETTAKLFGFRREGLSLTAIQKRAKKEGLKTAKGDPLSYYKIKELLYNGKGKAIGAAIGESAENPHDVLRSWVTDNLQADGPTDKSNKTRSFMGEIRGRYESYCKGLGMRPLPAGDVGIAINKALPGRRFKTAGQVAYRGVTLKAA